MQRVFFFIVLSLYILSSYGQFTVNCDATRLVVTCDIYMSDIPSDPIRVDWFPTDKSGNVIYQHFDVVDETTTVTLYRFTPLTNYTVIVEVPAVISTATTVMTGSTGITQLDTEPIADITGTPSYELLFFDIGNAYGFTDNSGWVVWFYNTEGTLPMEPAQAKSQLPNGNIVMLKNGYILEVTPSGETVQYAERTCSPYTNSYENHECRASRDGTRVYSIQESIVNETLSWDSQTIIVGQIINYWATETNDYVNLYASYEVWDPQTQYSRASKGELGVECLGDNGVTVQALDWSHCNSVSESHFNESAIIFSSRSLSSIVSADKDGGGVNWMISTEIDSDYTFPNATDKFYNQHDVQQIANGNIILIDNGADRPASEGSFSRAAEYYVNHINKTVTLVWEFLPYLPDGTAVQCFHGGSVSLSESGVRYASFPCDGTSSHNECSIVAFEISSDGSTIATLQFQNVVASTEKFIGSYRVEPWTTIAGERLAR